MHHTNREIKAMLQGAYKKLKSYYYYDKTLLFIKKQIAEFESDDEKFKHTFDELAEALANEDRNYFAKLIEKLDFFVYPKGVVSTADNSSAIVGTIDHHKNISKINFFINLPIELLILDCLWTLFLAKIANKQYNGNACSYAGKFKQSIFYFGQDDLYKGIDFESNRCFEPYFENYSRWQSDAFKRLRQGLNDRNQLMFSLDLKSFYYSVRFDFGTLNALLKGDSRLYGISFITNIQETIYKKYTNLIAKYKIGIDIKNNATIFPIGLLSPILLREIYLYEFDSNIKKALSPVHYGRYVDDMIIVIPAEIPPSEATAEFVCNLLVEKGLIEKKFSTKDDDFLFKGFEAISIQKKKINCFFFEQGSPNVLIDLAEKQIKNNSSEANLLPEFDIIQSHFNDTAYFFNSVGGSTKIRDIGILQSNNYAAARSITLMKQLMKNTHIRAEDRTKITEYVQDILEFYRGSASIEFMGSWISVFELIIQLKVLSNDRERKDPLAHRFYQDILQYIDREMNFDYLDEKEIYAKKKTTIFSRLKKDLKDRLRTSIAMAMALDYTWNASSKFHRNIELAKKFRKSNMFNHNLVSFPLLNYLPFEIISSCSFLEIQKEPWENSDALRLDRERLSWSPRFIHLDELLIYYFMQSTQNKKKAFDGRSDVEAIWGRYVELNKISQFASNDIVKQTETMLEESGVKLVDVFVSGDRSREYYIGLANTAVTEADAIQSLLHPEHKMTLEDKEQLFRMANTAFKEKANYITFPEFYVPVIWLKDITRFAQKNNVALVAGLRYIRNRNRAFNCTTIVQPCTHNGFRNVIALFREKNFYAPEEKEFLYKLGYHTRDALRPLYYVVHTGSLRYSTILCYEFTDIYSRASLKARVDALFVPQLNKDTNYFSSIVESTSRDLHCFIIQANTSKYGDSRITGPYDTIHKNVVQIKGGINDVVIIGKLELEKIQKARKQYELHRKKTAIHCFDCPKIKNAKYPNFFEACTKCKKAEAQKQTIKDVPANFK